MRRVLRYVVIKSLFSTALQRKQSKRKKRDPKEKNEKEKNENKWKERRKKNLYSCGRSLLSKRFGLNRGTTTVERTEQCLGMVRSNVRRGLIDLWLEVLGLMWWARTRMKSNGFGGPSLNKKYHPSRRKDKEFVTEVVSRDSCEHRGFCSLKCPQNRLFW